MKVSTLPSPDLGLPGLATTEDPGELRRPGPGPPLTPRVPSMAER